MWICYFSGLLQFKLILNFFQLRYVNSFVQFWPVLRILLSHLSDFFILVESMSIDILRESILRRRSKVTVSHRVPNFEQRQATYFNFLYDRIMRDDRTSIASFCSKISQISLKCIFFCEGICIVRRMRALNLAAPCCFSIRVG